MVEALSSRVDDLEMLPGSLGGRTRRNVLLLRGAAHRHHDAALVDLHLELPERLVGDLAIFHPWPLHRPPGGVPGAGCSKDG